VYILG